MNRLDEIRQELASGRGSHVQKEQIAYLLARLGKAEAVVEASRRWMVRKGHGRDGHSCQLCDDLTAYDAFVKGEKP